MKNQEIVVRIVIALSALLVGVAFGHWNFVAGARSALPLTSAARSSLTQSRGSS